MDAIRNIIPIAFLILVCDAPWLYFTSGQAQKMMQRIQGGAPMAIRWEGAPPVYLALAFLVLQAQSTMQAFLIGLCTYAVYDFTNYTTLKNYELGFAVADSVWGGVLFTLVRQVALYLNMV
jgi:uncharacterized membrane protein